MSYNYTKSAILYGALASVILLGVYGAVLSLVSGWNFTVYQFRQSWYFVISLALGFGAQVGLYVHLKQLIRNHAARLSGGVVATTGATSTVAMIACCSHYLVNILPWLGVAGTLSIIGQYQQQLFWLGLAANLLGIGYLLHRIRRFKLAHAPL